MKLYQYPKCSTCRKALKFLKQHSIDIEVLDITQTPPSKNELNRMLSYLGDRKKLFNTSGLQYRELNIKDKISSMKDDVVIELLSSNGMLIKRPFFLSDTFGLVGFKEEVWSETLK